MLTFRSEHVVTLSRGGRQILRETVPEHLLRLFLIYRGRKQSLKLFAPWWPQSLLHVSRSIGGLILLLDAAGLAEVPGLLVTEHMRRGDRGRTANGVL